MQQKQSTLPSILALPAQPNYSATAQFDTEDHAYSAENTPLTPQPLATKQRYVKRHRSAMAEHSTEKLMAAPKDIKLDSTVYHKTIPKHAKRCLELHSEIIHDQAFLQSMCINWENKLSQLKADEAMLQQMYSLTERDVAGVQPLFTATAKQPPKQPVTLPIQHSSSPLKIKNTVKPPATPSTARVTFTKDTIPAPGSTCYDTRIAGSSNRRNGDWHEAMEDMHSVDPSKDTGNVEEIAEDIEDIEDEDTARRALTYMLSEYGGIS
ncbi:hypothetical protein BDF14DRAFT_1090167 [Spinellus fusiger]|nr:hypothetical protein BDF14DRAFT_1090167 [Spinellus fusiger]